MYNDESVANIISLGAGVQSSVMSLMAASGEITPMPTAAIFADTGWEPAAIYKHLDWLETMLPFPVYRVEFTGYRNQNKGNIRSERGANQMPLFLAKVKGRRGMSRRQCTEDYKIVPIIRKSRELIGVKAVGRIKKGVYVNQWMGISIDEIGRMKDSHAQWIHKKYPLIDLGMTREDCLDYFTERFPGRTLARSACIGCPYRSDSEWYRMKVEDPVSWADVIAFDHNLRDGSIKLSYENPAYLHSSLVSLEHVDFSRQESNPGFDAECEGICGV
jgi:hypothetical protein